MTAKIFVGISLKMYFDGVKTADWSMKLAQIAVTHQTVKRGLVELVALPTALYIPTVSQIFKSAEVSLGGQDICRFDFGAVTGGISGSQLRESGATYAEIGHAERRDLFGDDDKTVALKMAATVRNSMSPILCLGELDRVAPEKAVEFCISQLESALQELQPDSDLSSMVIAYEPVWAIGAEKPAPKEHILETIKGIREFVGAKPQLSGVRIVYGGSAGPGLYSELGDSVDGLFLGRFAHNTENISKILDEIELFQNAQVAS